MIFYYEIVTTKGKTRSLTPCVVGESVRIDDCMATVLSCVKMRDHLAEMGRQRPGAPA